MVNKVKSKLADSNHVPQIGDAQAVISNLVVTGTYATDDDNIATAVNAILAALRYHGLIKE